MHLFWRSLYWLLDRRLTVFAVASPFLLARAVAGERFSRRLLGKSSYYYRRALLGWPRPGVPMYFNLHFSRFWRRLERRVKGRRPAARRTPRPGERPARVGCVGAFSELYSFPRHLFAAFPSTAELHLFDTRYKKKPFRPALFLEPLAAGYTPVDWPDDRGDLPAYRERLAAAARAINDSDLDLLLLIGNLPEVYDLLDRVETPCVAEMCIISDLIHHRKVDFHLYPQPGPDYYFRGDRLVSDLAHTELAGSLVFPASLFYDSRDLAGTEIVSWSDRDPVILFHGLLYKMASLPFLECVAALLEEDPALDFVFMGRDIHDSLAKIDAFARRRGLAGRFHYEGSFDVTRDADGQIRDPGWQRLVATLRRARLAPDPWPIGGGSSRFEAYLVGTPSVHFGVRLDGSARARDQPSLIEVPGLLVPAATAYGVEEYQDLCRRCLHDADFAAEIQRRQLAVAARVGDPIRWWEQLFDAYVAWRRGTGDGAG